MYNPVWLLLYIHVIGFISLLFVHNVMYASTCTLYCVVGVSITKDVVWEV